MSSNKDLSSMTPFLDIKKKVMENKIKEKEAVSRSDLQNKVVKAFKEFLDKPIDRMYNNYEYKPKNCVIRVFDYRPEKDEDTGIILLDGTSSSSLNYRTFSIGKVLAVGPDSDYNVGDIVKLNDNDTATLDNPRYEAWVNNPHNNSNMNRVGNEPPKSINNLMALNIKSIFSVNPMLIDRPEDDYVTFIFSDAKIQAKIKEPLKLIENV